MSARRFVVGATTVAVAIALVAAVATGHPQDLTGSEKRYELEAHIAADSSIASLRRHDLPALDAQLEAHRADAEFAYHFARQASPRELGDALSSVADPDVLGPVNTGLATTTYERLLRNLAATLALATRGSGVRALPASWTNDFATATTKPEMIYDETGTTDQRADQDQANKQNLLLLLSRGRWSTDFLVTLAEAYWNWEQDAGGAPWPEMGADDVVARYAPAPNGSYLTDGMVALMAALTANPEAAGWAFTDFQPGTTQIAIAGTDHELGRFAHYIFFEHEYGESTAPGAEGSGVTASFTALVSAIQATGGSSGDAAAGPQADAYVLQDFQSAVAVEPAVRAVSAVVGNQAWYESARKAISSWGLKEWASHLLGVGAKLPVGSEIAGTLTTVRLAIDGDWAGAGLSAVSVVPVVGRFKNVISGVQLVTKSVKVVTRTGKAIDLTSNVGQSLIGASDLGDGVLQFYEAEEYLAALDKPLPDVTYQYADTTYELAPDGMTLAHLSGPDLTVIESNLSRLDASRDTLEELTSRSAREDAAAAEAEGLTKYANAFDITPQSDQVLAHVDGRKNGRFFDGLARLSDGTYEGIVVTSESDPSSSSQVAFDELVTPETPARATLKEGEEVTISSVYLVTS